MSQNQHYVPKVYLKRFLNYNKKLYTIKNNITELPKKISEFSPKATGYQKDFYKIVDDNQLIRFGITDRNIIEGLFSGQLESNCSKIIDKVTKHGGSVNVNDAIKLLYLILSFKQRNPSMRQGFANKELIRSTFFNRIGEIISQRDTIEPLLMKHDGKTFEEFMETLKRKGEEFVNSPNTPINTHTEGLLNFFSGESDVIHEVASILFSMKWSVYQSPPSCPFITSDNPGFCMDSVGMVNSVAFGDIILFGFPLDPKNCLILTSSQSESKKAVEYTDCTAEAANVINLSTLTTSYKYVYSNDENTLIKTWRMKQRK